MAWNGASWTRVAASGGEVTTSQEKEIGAPSGATVSTQSVTVTSTGGLLLVHLSGQLKLDGGGSGSVSVTVDSTQTGFSKRIWTDRATWDPGFSLIMPVVAAPGKRVLAGRITCDTGSANAIYILGAVIQVMEI